MFEVTKSRLSRYRLTLGAVICFAALLLISAATLVRLITASVSKDKLIREELIQRDLNDLIGRLDTDERFVLNYNTLQLEHETRPISPLLLPRQYYTGLPAQPRFLTPRPPPRNCYVDLIPSGTEHPLSKDRFCAYFTEDRTLGTYLFFNMQFEDGSLVPLRVGDSTFTGDAIRLSVNNAGNVQTWWLALQSPARDLPGRYEITAFRELADKTRERDKRIEGWAYVSTQADNTQKINIISRLDCRAILAADAHPPIVKPPKKTKRKGGVFTTTQDAQATLAPWPPENWRDIRIRVSRNDARQDVKEPKRFSFEDVGITNLSISTLATSFKNAYATLSLTERATDGRLKQLVTVRPGPHDDDPIFRFEGQDLRIGLGRPINKTQPIPDTPLSFTVERKGSVVEEGAWQTGLLLFLIVILVMGVAGCFIVYLVTPILRMSKRTQILMQAPVDGAVELPYNDAEGEIGTLSRGFNELLRERKRQMELQQAVREAHKEEVQRRQLTDLKNREVSLRMIGHEIRSPLQALMGLVPEGNAGRRYIDRMYRAVTHLFGATGSEPLFDAVPIALERMDIAEFLETVAEHTPRIGLDNVEYYGPGYDIHCEIDPDAMEDSLDHILKNANRHRYSATSIRITLTLTQPDLICISIENDGDPIPEHMLEEIFQPYVSNHDGDEGDSQGIGLYAARNYIHRMNGNITARNTETGVSFDIVLPLAEEVVPG